MTKKCTYRSRAVSICRTRLAKCIWRAKRNSVRAMTLMTIARNNLIKVFRSDLFRQAESVPGGTHAA